MDTSSRPSCEHSCISYESLICSASSAIFALKQAGFRFTTTINREHEPVPGHPAYHVFIALHDHDANGLVPHTLIDLKFTADDPRPLVIVHDRLLGRYPQHLAKQESLRRFRNRLADHNVCFPMRPRL